MEATNVILSGTGYKPREQQRYVHRNLKRFNVIVAHRRLGKTYLCVNELVDHALKCEHKNPRVAYIAPTYTQAKRISWDYLKDATKNYPERTTNEHELRIDLPRPKPYDDIARIMLLGGDNPETLRGIYLDLVILDEYGLCNPSIWTEIIRPTLLDRQGKAIFIGTFKGTNHFYDLYNYALANPKVWFSAKFKASETKIIPHDELMELKSQMSEEEFNQEFECEPNAALIGAYFGKQIEAAHKEGRITDVPVDPGLKVDTFWDLGMDDYTSIWFIQRAHGKFRVIDYYENNSEGLPHYVRILEEKKYIYGVHEFPFDLQVRELGSGESRFQTLHNLGMRNIVVQPRTRMKEDAIEAARRVFPLCVFDATRCKYGLDGLRNYRRKWDEVKRTFATQPLHTWASHPADSFMTFAMSTRKGTDMNQAPHPKFADNDYDIHGS